MRAPRAFSFVKMSNFENFWEDAEGLWLNKEQKLSRQPRCESSTNDPKDATWKLSYDAPPAPMFLTCARHEALLTKVLQAGFDGQAALREKRKEQAPVLPRRRRYPLQLHTLSFQDEGVAASSSSSATDTTEKPSSSKIELWLHDSRECTIGHGDYEKHVLLDFQRTCRTAAEFWTEDYGGSGAAGGSGFFLDVGANVGIWSLAAAQNGLPAMAFEPMPYNRELLEKNLRSFAPTATKSRVFGVALTDVDARAPRPSSGIADADRSVQVDVDSSSAVAAMKETNTNNTTTSEVQLPRGSPFRCILPSHYHTRQFARGATHVTDAFML